MTTIFQYHFLSMRYQLAKIISTFASKELERDLSVNNNRHDAVNNLLDLHDPKEPKLDVEGPLIADNNVQDSDSHAGVVN